MGGAEIYGLLDSVIADAATFPPVFAAPPTGAVGALLRLDVGPAGFSDDFDGFDILLFLNLLGEALDDPMLGIGGTSIDLLTRGFANNADFGGAGPVTLTSLGALAVWATLPQRPPRVQRDWLRDHLIEFEDALFGRNFADPEQGYAKYIDVDAWIDTWLLVELTCTGIGNVAVDHRTCFRRGRRVDNAR